MDVILTSIKKLLGIPATYTNYDNDLILYINTVFSELYQMGVGPITAFSISGTTEKWTDFISDLSKIEMIKIFVYQKVRLMFDPPQNGQLIEVINRNLEELTWRLYISEDPKQRTFDGI